MSESLNGTQSGNSDLACPRTMYRLESNRIPRSDYRVQFDSFGSTAPVRIHSTILEASKPPFVFSTWFNRPKIHSNGTQQQTMSMMRKTSAYSTDCYYYYNSREEGI